MEAGRRRGLDQEPNQVESVELIVPSKGFGVGIRAHSRPKPVMFRTMLPIRIRDLEVMFLVSITKSPSRCVLVIAIPGQLETTTGCSVGDIPRVAVQMHLESVQRIQDQIVH